MTQLTTSVRRTGGELDVYTALLGAALLVLLIGVVAVAMGNMKHSSVSGSDGGPFTVVPER